MSNLEFGDEIKARLKAKKGARMYFREALHIIGARMQDAPQARRTLTIMGGRLEEEGPHRILYGFEIRKDKKS